MTSDEWNKLLAPSVHWKDAYLSVEREARAYLTIGNKVNVSTSALVEALYPIAEARGEAGVTARGRIFKALAALADHGLRDCNYRGEPKPMRGRTIRPNIWTEPRSINLQPKAWDADAMYRKGDRFTWHGLLCEVLAV